MNGIPIDPCGTDTADWVHDRIRAYNAQYITDCGELNFCVRGPDAAPLGGIAASRDLDCVTVDFLYVEPSARGDGLGRRPAPPGGGRGTAPGAPGAFC